MSPLRTRRCPAAIVVATTSILQNQLLGMGLRRFVTMMQALPQTAGMRRRSFGLHRDGKQCSEERDQQQKSGGNALHAVW